MSLKILPRIASFEEISSFLHKHHLDSSDEEIGWLANNLCSFGVQIVDFEEGICYLRRGGYGDWMDGFAYHAPLPYIHAYLIRYISFWHLISLNETF